jgi:AbiJ N-terminal domain 4
LERLRELSISMREIYSRRNAIENVGPLLLNEVPYKLKNQIFHVWDDFLNQKRIEPETRKSAWEGIYKTVRREHGHGKQIYYGSKHARDQVEEYYNSFSLSEVDKHLDIVEIIFYQMRRIQLFQLERFFKQPLRITYDDSVKALNNRFAEYNFGYRFEQHQVIKIESQYHYSEIVKPAFELLKDERFKIANQEYFAAQAYFRKGLFEPCIVECAKAFESTIKVICHELNWKYEQSDSSTVLLKIIINNGFIPKYFESSLMSIATIRNKTSAHGKGVEGSSVDQHLARLSINQTASILSYFLDVFNSYKVKP